VDRFATFTGRFGYAITPAFLFYGKVGWGSYRTSLTAINTVNGVGLGGGGRTQSGLDAGVGGEWMFAPNWSLWIEWDHIFADDKTVFFRNLAGGTTANVRRDFDKVLVGLNWGHIGSVGAY
jgi:outer membrane immunogenic protein